MTFGIPDEANATYPAQAGIDAVDFDIIAAANNRYLVTSGCAVTAQGSPNMTVAVAAGVVGINGARTVVAGGNSGTFTAADVTNPRFDLVTINSSGSIVVTTGTAAANPVYPAIPATSVVLATVYIPANATTITSGQIADKRMVGVETDVQVFTSNGTWTKPTGVTKVHVALIGGGGGGGSGRTSASGTAAAGGGGGGGGAYNAITYPASALPSTVSVTVGAGGSAGTAVTASSTNGNVGTAGGITHFGTGGTDAFHTSAGGGNVSAAAGTATGSGVTSGVGLFSGGGSSAPQITTGANGSVATGFAAGGGGSGGGFGTTPAAAAGGVGGGHTSTAVSDMRISAANGGAAGASGNNAGGIGASVTANVEMGGDGGGGGGTAATATTAGSGGAGGSYGAGGGGGGAALNTGTSGAGGAGAPGIVVVTAW